MNQKKKVTAIIKSQERIAENIYDMRLETELAREAEAGQFIAVYPNDGSRLLPRPISICGTDKENGVLRIVYRIAGKGTAEFSHLRAGESIPVLGVLGNGFPLEEARGKRALLLGGGIGIPPMLETAKQLEGDKRIVLGYRNGELFLKEEFEACGPVSTATEDGSAGVKGNVLDAVRQEGLTGDVIFACGPMPMLRAVKAYAARQGVRAYISLEERMACGVGACLGCVCRTKEKDAHSHVHNARICTEGPVFEAQEVEI